MRFRKQSDAVRVEDGSGPPESEAVQWVVVPALRGRGGGPEVQEEAGGR